MQEPTITSVVMLVDKLIAQAIRKGASDIHVESTDQGIRIRYRIDGVLLLQELGEGLCDRGLCDQLLSRLKVLAHIDIAEKRIPQDGKFQVEVDKKMVDLRVSTFPSLHGEKIVVRILDRERNCLTLDALGFSPAMQQQFKQLIDHSNGFLLVAGPTGSGKTTTLYAALSQLNTPEKNIITLEDPVEYNIDGITQGQIRPEAGFTFEKGIRAMLRQDPDIVMIGEVRDKQTAQVAIEAALTGHLVLSTIHTNDAPSVIMRLMDMGIQPFLLNASITGVLAQRLARTICQACKVADKPTQQEKALMKSMGVTADTVYRGTGCEVCFQTGYRGRIGIFELLTMTGGLRSCIVQHPLFDEIYAQCRTDGMQTLMQDGAQKVRDGFITVHELARVLA